MLKRRKASNVEVGALCVMKFNKWKNALERFADHESSKYHCDSVLKVECTLSIESGKQDSIAVQLNHQAKQQILDSRRKITPIIETVIFCVRQTRNSFERTSGQRSAFFCGSRIRRYQRWKLSSLDSIWRQIRWSLQKRHYVWRPQCSISQPKMNISATKWNLKCLQRLDSWTIGWLH